MRDLKITPHVAQNTANRRSAIDGRTTRHEGYTISQRKRKRVEEVFGWMKTIALQRKTRFRGPDRVGWMFTLAAAAYNLVRMRNLTAETAWKPPEPPSPPSLAATDMSLPKPASLPGGLRTRRNRQTELQKVAFPKPARPVLLEVIDRKPFAGLSDPPTFPVFLRVALGELSLRRVVIRVSMLVVTLEKAALPGFSIRMFGSVYVSGSQIHFQAQGMPP
jgi:hypothetical protein